MRDDTSSGVIAPSPLTVARQQLGEETFMPILSCRLSSRRGEYCRVERTRGRTWAVIREGRREEDLVRMPSQHSSGEVSLARKGEEESESRRVQTRDGSSSACYYNESVNIVDRDEIIGR